MVILAPQYTQRSHFWVEWKSVNALKGGQYQHDEDDAVYTVWFYDGPEVHTCTIWKGELPDGVTQAGYTQDQNDADKSDWETNYKLASNTQLEPKAADGRLSVRVTTAKQTKSFKLRTVTFYSAATDKTHSVNPLTDADYGDVTTTLWKWDPTANDGAGGWVTSAAADATKTIIDWDPTYAYEIIGGFLDIPTDLADGTSDAWYLGCVALPDYAIYGLSIDFVSEVNLEAVTTQRVVSDGRATQYLSPTIVGGVNQHTNRLRWIVKHPAGVQKRFQLYIETFV